jgi:hypothetical protein
MNNSNSRTKAACPFYLWIVAADSRWILLMYSYIFTISSSGIPSAGSFSKDVIALFLGAQVSYIPYI